MDVLDVRELGEAERLGSAAAACGRPLQPIDTD